jgi:hypothetical protein
MPLGFASASGTPVHQLKTAFISEGIESVTCDYDMIKDCHIQQDAAFFDFLCYFLVGFAGLDIPAGVVERRDA